MGFLAAGAIAAIGVGAAAEAGAFDPSKPQQRSLSKETQDYLNQQGPLFASHSQYDPQYAELYNRLQQQGIFGGNGQTGMLQQYEQAIPGLTSAMNGAQNSQFANQMGQYQQYAGKVPQAYLQGNPQQAQLLSQIMQMSSSDLSNGMNLSPMQQRQVSQNVRGAQAARGFGFGGADAAQEAVASTQAGQGLYQQRLANAGNASQLYASMVPQLGVPGQQQPMASGAFNSLFGAGGQPANYAAGQFGTPFNSYSAGLYGGNQQLDWQYQQTVANNRAAGASMMAGGLSKAYGGG